MSVPSTPAILPLLLGRVATVAWPPLGIPDGLPPIMEDGVDLDPSILPEEGD
jgi:hypothetical protein